MTFRVISFSTYFPLSYSKEILLKAIKAVLDLINLVIVNFLEFGLIWNRWDKVVYPILLTAITLTVLYISKLRKLSLIVSFILLFVMIFLYLMNELNLANAFGSFGFSLLLITLIIYLPQIIKEGFIEEF